ncbi:MAG: hypothetical protein KDL87_09665 [Verrucomicrobiae bacterium]|nr:hypothetical protein [Verrucomicrobiae bacterium]
MSLIADRTDKVIHLRSLLRERFPEAHRAVQPVPAAAPAPLSPEAPAAFLPDFPLGVDLLDRLDEGRGLARGTMTEIVSRRRGGGAGTLIAGLLQAAATAERRYPLALIDGADSFDPGGLSDAPEAAAALCRQLLWVRCRHRIDRAIQAADLLLRDGNLPVVLLDLQLCRIRDIRQGLPGGPSAWHRLRSLAEKTGTLFLAFTPEPLIPSVAWRLELDQHWPLDALDRLPVTGDLHREPIHFTLTRARPTTMAPTTAESWAMAG